MKNSKPTLGKANNHQIIFHKIESKKRKHRKQEISPRKQMKSQAQSSKMKNSQKLNIYNIYMGGPLCCCKIKGICWGANMTLDGYMEY